MLAHAPGGIKQQNHQLQTSLHHIARPSLENKKDRKSYFKREGKCWGDSGLYLSSGIQTWHLHSTDTIILCGPHKD